MRATDDPSGFVVLADYAPHIAQEIRYYSTFNFIGERIDGYEEPCALLTKEAARALGEIGKVLDAQGFRIKVFDAYRPACAVEHFMRWGRDNDQRMKPYFYPALDKRELIAKGYIAARSAHSRGSAVDVALIDMRTGKEPDMGSPFDLFDEKSHSDYREITHAQYENRMFLRKAMMCGGFLPLDCEWWHFSLANEPYPDTYFTFPVSSEYLKKYGQ